MKSIRTIRNRAQRRGLAVGFVVVGLVMLLGMAALVVDLGLLYLARTELQASADAGAMAGTWELLNEQRIKDAYRQNQVFAASRNETVRIGGLNAVLSESPDVGINSSNNPSGDIVLGYLSDPDNLSQPLSYANPDLFNSIRVRVRRDSIRNGSVILYFARIFGIDSSDVIADATATFKDGVVGYRVTEQTGNANLMPFALHVNAWNSLVNGAGPGVMGDNYEYDPDTGAVNQGYADGLIEMNLYPGGGAYQLPPGNFGTVNIGASSNSTSALGLQIREGITGGDLAYHGGELNVGSGSLWLSGDTGLSAAIKDDLGAIIGQGRAVPLFDLVTGTGNNSSFRIVGFGGIRVLDVHLTGAMNQKSVIIQAAVVVDETAISQPGPGSSQYVYQPVRLTR